MPYWEQFMDKIREWLDTTQYKDYSIEVASADASFRKYYRLKKDDKTYILMDSSLEKESLKPFIQVSEKLLHVKVNAPKIYKKDIQKGYLVIEDFDNTNLLDILDGSNFKEYYQKAIDTIVLMQNADTSSLPLYNAEFLHAEMDLMSEWYIQKLLHVKLDRAQKELIKRALDYICETVLAQPQNIFVHRDFHSRNIMIKADKTLGIIDYQDAMNGSLCYDLVSLLKDCYIEFDTKEIDSLALGFRDKKGLHVSDEEFLRWFDFTGMQRHIKVLGIFSRLYLRDNKDGYLKDIPLTLKYLINSAKRYEHTREFALLMQEITTRRV
jgi:aminoglycoside/choline kinase family phosphotransferase